ncbi:MAG: SDR family NAD(P)-dependent oxidoreductase [Microthrixaceae bacterium]
MGAPIKGRPVVVTGAGNGIGAALANEASSRGASAVAVVDIDLADAERVAGEIDRAVAYHCDVTDKSSVDSMAEAVLDSHGLPGLVCANAGVGPAGGPLLETDPSQVEWVLGVNVIGVLSTMQAFGQRMVSGADPGWLMATGSEHSLGRPHLGMGIYTASKHAVFGMCDVLRGELPEHVGVSLLCPGLTTSMLWNASAKRPDSFGGPADGDQMGAVVMEAGMDASVVAQRALDGAEAGRFVIPTHYNALDYAEARWTEVAEAFDELSRIDTSTWHVDDVAADLIAQMMADD